MINLFAGFMSYDPERVHYNRDWLTEEDIRRHLPRLRYAYQTYPLK